jgi:hypothetical protein
MPSLELVMAMPPVYSNAIPFTFSFTGIRGENFSIWEPQNAAFELCALTIRGTVAMDLNVCDTTPAIPIGFVQIIPGSYIPLQIGWGRVRSSSFSQAKLILLDPVGVACTIKGIAYGFEMTREGLYRS